MNLRFFNVEKQLNLTREDNTLTVFLFSLRGNRRRSNGIQMFSTQMAGRGIEKKWHNLSSSRSCERARTTERSRLARLGSQPPNQPQDTHTHSAPLLCSAARKCSSLRLPPFRPTTVVYSTVQGRGGQRREGKKKKELKKLKKKKKNLTRQIHACATNVSTGWHPTNKKKKKKRDANPKRLFQIARATCRLAGAAGAAKI